MSMTNDDGDKIENFNEVLSKFKIKAMVVNHEKIRNISIYSLRLYAGTQLSTLRKYSEELALAMHSKGRLNFRPDLDTGLVMVEMVDEKLSKIDIFKELKDRTIPKGKIPIFLGSSTDGKDMWMDLARCPHLLVAGTTGSGKSVLLHTIIANILLLSKADVYIIDTKALEFDDYADTSVRVSISTSYAKGAECLEGILQQMEYRYSYMQERNLSQSPFDPIVVIIDEFADLIMQDNNDYLYNMVCRLVQKSRAAGIHAILATQRPSVDIIRGVIKANLPARIAFKVPNKTASRVILDENGAENLIGNGDAIISNYEHDFVRFQAAFSSGGDYLKSGLKREHLNFEV